MSQQLFINTDGGSRGNPGPAATGVTVKDSSQTVVFEAGTAIGVGTNNEAEYQAVLHSLAWLLPYCQTQAVTEVTWRLDSKLVVEQLSRRWKIKEPRMLELATQCWQQLAQLAVPYHFEYVPRAENSRADALVNQALDALN